MSYRIPMENWLDETHVTPPPDPDAALPKQLRAMHAVYGRDPEERRCGDCANLRRYRYHNKNYHKCALYGETHGAGTDWRRKWQACGKFEDETP